MIPKFDTFACVGDSVSWKSGAFDMTATIHFDSHTSPNDYNGPGMCFDVNDPDYGEQSRSIIDAWNRDEWFYCGVVVAASLCGKELGSASLWGIECNFPGSDNAYLAEVAADLEGEAVADASALAVKIATAAA